MTGAAHGFPIVLSDLTLEYPAHGASPAHVALHAVLGILEAEAAFQAQPAVGMAAQAQPVGVHALVQPDHPRRLAGAAAHGRGTLRGGTCRVPPGVGARADDHQDDQGGEIGHGGNVAAPAGECNRCIAALASGVRPASGRA